MSLTATDFAQGVQALASVWFNVAPGDDGDWQDARALEIVRLTFRTTTMVVPTSNSKFRMARVGSESPEWYGRTHPRLLTLGKI